MDIARLIRERLRDALGVEGGTNIAVSHNRDGDGHHTTVYSDGDVTIVDRDGEREVIHHDRRTGEDDAPDEG